jgi:hypothetical protein
MAATNKWNRLEFDSMDAIFRRLLDDNFSELDGLIAAASIPVPENLINEMIAVTLRGNKNITSCQVSIHAQNRVFVNLKTPLLPLSLNLKLRLDNSIQLGDSPTLTVWLENNLLLGRLGSVLNILPEGIKMHGDQIVMDIGSFLRSPEQKRILALLKDVEIQTVEGKLILAVKIEVGDESV